MTPRVIILFGYLNNGEEIEFSRLLLFKLFPAELEPFQIVLLNYMYVIDQIFEPTLIKLPFIFY